MEKGGKSVIPVASRQANLKKKLRAHLRSLGFEKAQDGSLRISGSGKDIVRALHQPQRDDRVNASHAFISKFGERLLPYFASGDEVVPEKITPVLERVSAETIQGNLFRLASLTWSVPVSNGFGRRLRYLVWDQHNGKLIGLLAIGDPVYNLAARDALIGWSTDDRSARLVNIMDAYVLGALPPYNALLCGKLVACLLRTRDLYDDFSKAYNQTAGIISQEEKRARLIAITTSSSMGRSSVYNRLKLDGTTYLESIGYTGGWGHFHIPDQLFLELRDYLRVIDHPYADLHRFGEGPNWRLRTTRAALSALGFKEDMLRHGIKREVFICQLADNAVKMLRSGKGRPDLSSLLSAREVAELAISRWVLPRAKRRPEFKDWHSSGIIRLLEGQNKRFPNSSDKSKWKKTKATGV